MKNLFTIIIAVFLVNVSFAQWVQLNSGTLNNLNSVVFTDSITGYAVGDSGIILKTVNGGMTWSTLYSGTSLFLWSVYFTDANTGYAVGSGGIILKTSNAGENWLSLSSGTLEPLFSVYFINGNIGYAVGGGGTIGNDHSGIILKTINGGITWNSQIYKTPSYLMSVYFPSTDTGYIAGGSDDFQYSNATILKTIDGGTTWKTVLHEYDFYFRISLHSINFMNQNKGYVVGARGRILKPSEVDSIWIPQVSGIWSNLLSINFTPNANEPKFAYAVGTGGTILKNLNGDTTWIPQTSGTLKNLNSITFIDAYKGFIVGDSGVILRTNNGGGLGANEIQSATVSIKIYPNPTLSKLIIESEDIRENAYLSIFNLYGQVILQQKVKHSKNIFDVSLLPSGVYFINLTVEKTFLIGKFIKE